MASSSRRFGISDDPIELELRIQRIEEELSVLQRANVDSSATAQFARVGEQIEQVTGLAVIRDAVGGMGVRWNPVLNPDLSHYEIQFSSTEQFLSDTTVTENVVAGRTQFMFTGAAPGATFFVRMRAIDRNNTPGIYSSTLNTSSGQATQNQLAQGAATELVSDVVTVFSPTSITGNSITTETAGPFGSAVITTSGGVVFPFSVFEAEYDITQDGTAVNTAQLTIEVMRNGIVIQTIPMDIAGPSTPSPSQTMTFGAFAGPDQPPIGTHLYQVRYTASSTGAPAALTVTFTRQVLELIEVRR